MEIEGLTKFVLPVSVKGESLKEGDRLIVNGVNHTVIFDQKTLSFVLLSENKVVINNIPSFLKRNPEKNMERDGNVNDDPKPETPSEPS